MTGENTIHSYWINNLQVQTGDILCLSFDSRDSIKRGDYWRILGLLIPGEVDHVAVYVGPDGRCVEASARGVYAFDLEENEWSPEKMFKHRGRFKDSLIGAAYPLHDLDVSVDSEIKIRLSVAEYCLDQAKIGKPYNINLLDPDREDAFYCAQLVYKAYIQHGINLNTNLGVANLPGINNIVFPQEIWHGCFHRKTEGKTVEKQ